MEDLLNQIQNNPLFLRLKNVVENGYEGDKIWHDHEPVFDHSIKTLRIARERLSGDFIFNPEAKKLFLAWVEQDIHGTKQKDLSLLIALTHDCGKILYYKESSKEDTLISPKPNFPDQFMCPGHEYWGSKIVVPKLLENTSLSANTKRYIQQVIEYHGLYSNPYFPNRANWTLEEIMKDVKAYYCGYYIEGLFNMYCDGYTASAFEVGKKRIEELFNEPSFYSPRYYFIP